MEKAMTMNAEELEFSEEFLKCTKTLINNARNLQEKADNMERRISEHIYEILYYYIKFKDRLLKKKLIE